MDNESNRPQQVFLRLHWVILYNWFNLTIFELANQRLPGSVQEDLLNKPWRPVPSGLTTTNSLRQIMLVAIPACLAFNHFILHLGLESALIIIICWMYNDLGGGDGNWILRNLLLAVGFGPFNAGSTKLAAQNPASPIDTLNTSGLVWTVMASAVILTTMQVQDLKDTAGDRKKGRLTAPIVLGEHIARLTVATPVTLWSFVCTFYWDLGVLGLAPIGLGLVISWRCMALRGKSVDRKTWELWALWISVLYAAPFLYSLRSRVVVGRPEQF
ncbi:UbiA prenyltransferase family-domain-containing protein [Phaeosphaeriaceae sp. PMI808]|nr:UbiA prenyltransferase family-domain-containing protein [Phaeosphaeriaceae sp. PMI808]